jgi:ABC-type uncharacterized transport system substrate-binding protein
VVAVVSAGAGDTTSLAIFRDELAKLGWVEGRNLRIDYRIAGGNVDRMRAIAVELIGLGPDVIVIGGAPMVRVAQQQTQTSERGCNGGSRPLGQLPGQEG